MKKLLYLPIIALGFTCLLVGQVWKKKPSNEWSERETIRVMERSPWTQKKVFRGHPGRSPMEGPGGELPGDRTIYASFQSARPFRMALARWAVLSQSLTPDEAEAFVEQEEFSQFVMISVWGPGGQDMDELEVSTEHLQSNTYLELKKSKTKIPLARYMPPSETGTGEGLFYFPRSRDGQPLITLDEQEVRFVTEFSKKTRLNLKYKLKNMVYKDSLEM